MPALFSQSALRCALAGVIAIAALAPAAPALAAPAKVDNSDLDAQLFYQLLIGEIELSSGSAGTAYEVMLDAARRSRDEQLFRRATDIAIQARAGDQALAAARAWRTALPESQEAHRYILQLLVTLNRSSETLEPMRSLLRITPQAQRVSLIEALPRFFGRSTDKAQAAALVERALQTYVEAPETRAVARVAMGRAWLAAGDSAKALELARRAHSLDPQSDQPALLALELLPATPSAEDIVKAHLKAKPETQGLRMGYVRLLTTSQRYVDAIAQLEIATSQQPKVAGPWLTLGALHLELRHAQQATSALKTFVALLQAEPPAAAAAKQDSDEENEDAAQSATTLAADRGLTQAWLMLSQAAEQQGKLSEAESWLAKIDDTQRALEVQTRRASLLARQGKVKEARELLQRAPEKGPQDQRAKLLAEAQVLRDVKQWEAAYAVLAQANQRFENDADLMYEQSMMAE
jgi:tetratricopeptide (TPR) repeat protein